MSSHSQRPLKTPEPATRPGQADDGSVATFVSDGDVLDETHDHTRDETHDRTHEHPPEDDTTLVPREAPDGEGLTVVRADGEDAETRIVGLPGDDAFVPRDTANTPDPYIGKVISGRYRVLSKLGEGGMGTVYLAEHVVIERKVALKVLSEDFARKPELVARFMQEAKAASRIGHENIVDVTDFGQTEAGSVFFAMEHLRGADLATAIRAQALMPFARARAIAIQICNALSAAHAKGIIHRDMKPENVFLVERDGNPDFVKVLDFGIAKMSAVDEVGDRLTRTGMIFGTPEYMSPEQARGDRPDHRVDIYAVGCMLYEMLTGDVPFYAETFMGVLTKHMFEPPDPLAVRVPDGHFSPQVEALVMRALAKNRDERFQTTRELALALAACDEQPSTPSGVRPLPRPRSTSRSASAAPVAAVDAMAVTTDFPVTPVPQKTASSSRWPILVGALAVAAVGIGSYLMWRSRYVTAHVPTTSAPPPAPGAAPPAAKQTVVPPSEPPPVATPPAVPMVHTITLQSSGGELGFLYNGPDQIATIPGQFKMRHQDGEVELTGRRPGSKECKLHVRPDHDGVYTCRWEPSPKRSQAGTKGNVLRPQLAKPSEPPPAPTPQAPPPKKNDLMNPWSPSQSKK